MRLIDPKRQLHSRPSTCTTITAPGLSADAPHSSPRTIGAWARDHNLNERNWSTSASTSTRRTEVQAVLISRDQVKAASGAGRTAAPKWRKRSHFLYAAPV